MKLHFDNNYTQIAIDLANNNRAEFAANDMTPAQAEDILRKEIFEAVGLDINKPFTPRMYENNKGAIFAIIEETISPIINDRLEQQMGSFAEVRNLAWGDTIVFDVENPDLFEVAVISDGTSNLRRQRLDNGKIPVEVKTLGIKVYDEFYRFMAGRTNWAQVIDKVVKSYEKKVATMVHDTLYGAYNNIDPLFKYTGTYNEDEIIRVCQNIEALYGSAMIVGTNAALRPLKPSYVGDATKDQYNQLGRVGVFNGFETVALAQSFKAGTYDFNLSNKDLLILPALSNKFIKIVTEGTAFIKDFDNAQGDQSIEHIYTQKIGVAVSYTDKYGMIRLS